MTREEILREINRVDNEYFDLKMKDRWDNRDREQSMKFMNELRELRKKLREIEEV